MTSLTLRLLLVIVIAVSVGLADGLSGQRAPTLVVVSPDAETLVVGPFMMVADVQPASEPVTQIEFFVDGTVVCRARIRPFACSWNAGPQVVPRVVRVVAHLADGRRLVESLRTAGLDVNDAVDVDAVVVSVRVTDRDDRFVSGLTRSDFRILEDGVPQEVSGFATEDGAADVILALDVSASMVPAMAELRSATALFLDSMRPQDAITLSAFNTNIAVVARPTDTPAERLSALDRLTASGDTALYDSTIRAAGLFGDGGQRAIVVFTDGADVASRGTMDGVRSALHGADVGLYVIAQGRAAADSDLRDRLARLARETGGAAFFSARLSALREHFAEIADDLAHRYMLSFSPKRPLGDGGWRELTVELVDSELHHSIRAREGYLSTRRSER